MFAVIDRWQVSDGTLPLNMGPPYPALMRLEQRGLVR